MQMQLSQYIVEKNCYHNLLEIFRKTVCNQLVRIVLSLGIVISHVLFKFFLSRAYLFKRQQHKMLKLTQTIRQFVCLSFSPIWGGGA